MLKQYGKVPFDLSRLKMINGKMYANTDDNEIILIEEDYNVFLISVINNKIILNTIKIMKNNPFYLELYLYFEIFRDIVCEDIKKDIAIQDKIYSISHLTGSVVEKMLERKK